MDHIWFVLELLQAVKTSNLALYTHCLFKMADFSLAPTDTTSQDISPFYAVFLANLDETHPDASELLRSGVISEARSFVAGNRCSVNKPIEETFTIRDKSHGGPEGCGAGLMEILTNFNAYRRWVQTAHEKAQYVNVTYSKADM